MLEALAQEQAEIDVEPDNWATVMLFLRLQTQWRHGFGGATGLDYPAVFQTMDRLRIADTDGLIFEGLQVMELGALRAMTEKG